MDQPKLPASDVSLRFALPLCVVASWACSPSRDRIDPAADWRRVPVSLELRMAKSAPGPDLVMTKVYGQPDTVYLQREAQLSTGDIAKVEAVKAMGGKGLVLEVWFTKAGARRLADFTREHIGDTLAVLINSVVVSTPMIQETLGDDTKLPSHIGVPLDPADARQLALAVSKTWPQVPAGSKRDAAKSAR